MSRSWWKWLGLGLIGTALSSSAVGLSVYIDRPTFLDAALGEVEVVARVESREPIRSVALYVDGRPQAILESSPFRWIVDVGEENVEHTFKVVARGAAGEMAEDVVATPRLQIDDQVDLELQQIYVTVTRNGKTVEDLTRDRFQVSDEDTPQQIVTFERGDVPLTAVVLLDVSASMSGGELDLALSGSKAFIDGLLALDQTKLVLFSDRIVRTTDFTGFREVLTAALSDVRATGATALNDHLYVGLKELEQRQGRQVVLLLSDGVDSASALSMSDVLQYAERSPSLVYWLRLPRPGADVSSAWLDIHGYREELARLERLIDDSGGRILELGSVSEAASAFAEVLEELRGQYVLGYYPTHRADDGSWHTVKVKVAGPGLRVRVRKGYIDF